MGSKQDLAQGYQKARNGPARLCLLDNMHLSLGEEAFPVLVLEQM